jgi:hypothetical protein
VTTSLEGLLVSNKFYPRGAIASFLVLIALYAGIWYGLYFISLSRG